MFYLSSKERTLEPVLNRTDKNSDNTTDSKQSQHERKLYNSNAIRSDDIPLSSSTGTQDPRSAT